MKIARDTERVRRLTRESFSLSLSQYFMVRAREIEIPGGHKLTIHELDEVYDSLTGRPLTGSWLWDSTLVLSHWIASQAPQHFPLLGKSVLELGAGAGLPGLTAALLGASRVVLTDIGPILPGLVKNVEANGLGDRVEVRELVWGSMDESSGWLGKFDMVLLSDVFYDPAEVADLARTLETVCKEDTMIWAASEVRPWTGECLNELAGRGFVVAELIRKLGPASSTSTDTGPSWPLHQEDGSEMFAVHYLLPPGGNSQPKYEQGSSNSAPVPPLQRT